MSTEKNLQEITMKVSREQAAQHRERIVETAAQLFRERGFEGIGVADLMKEAGLKPPAAMTKKFAVMGKEFDPAKPDAYLASFAIKRTA